MTLHLQLRVPPLAVTAMAGFIAAVAARLFPALTLAVPGRLWLAVACGGVGLACTVLGVASFRHARTTVNPLQPAAATALVISGVYRITRNPMYLGFLFLLLGEIAWLANAVACFAAPALVLYLNRFQIRPEERALRERFGSDYLRYAARVRRWI